jgi:cytoskeleton protein RodZ
MTAEQGTEEDFLGLRTKREALRLTLKDISSLTRISLVNLEAIENGAFSDLPVPIYTKNFIKTYARALDLDSKPILDSYEAYLASLQKPQPSLTESKSIREPLFQKLIPYKAYIAAFCIIIIVAVITVFILHEQQPVPVAAVSQPPVAATVTITPPAIPPEQTAPIVQAPQTTPAKTNPQPLMPETVKQPPASTEQKNAATAKVSPGQAPPAVEKKAPLLNSEGNNVLVIQAAEATWLRISIDKNPSFQILLKPGEEISRKGGNFTMDIGNAGGIKMQFQGKTIENLGKSGEVVHLQLP